MLVAGNEMKILDVNTNLLLNLFVHTVIRRISSFSFIIFDCLRLYFLRKDLNECETHTEARTRHAR